MTDYQIRYDNLDSLDVEFSDVTYGLGYMSDTQDILAKASSMATSYSMTVRQANKGNKANQQIVDMVENGLSLTNKKIVNAADNQNMVVDESGMLMREKNEFGDDYSNEQVKIINHGFYYTNDNWKTVKTDLENLSITTRSLERIRKITGLSHTKSLEISFLEMKLVFIMNLGL